MMDHLAMDQLAMDQLAEVCERIASSNSRNKKVALLAAYLAPLEEADLARALRFLSGSPVETKDGRKLSLGHSTLREAAVAATGWDLEMFRLCHREVGDTGETISLLLHGCTGNQPLSLAEAERLYMAVYNARRVTERVELLRQAMLRYRPLTIRYLMKGITGALRIGLQERLMEEAVARATGREIAAVRDANNRLGDLAAVARAARRDELHTVEARLFHPLDFMLAKPLEDAGGVDDPAAWLVEDKFDGIRAQVHVADGQVRIFTRGLEDVTAAFPDVVRQVAGLPVPVAMDGEVLGWRDGRALPFNLLQQRIARKKVPAKLIEEVPVRFIAYDLLYHGGEMLVDRPVEHRRALLAALPVPLSEQVPLVDVEAQYRQARDRGNEGLMLKRRGSSYESGKRSASWLKVKRPYGTLDVVITAAEQGHGRRAKVWSDYTFAVRDGERFLNVGKAYSGLTDDEIRELTKRLRAAVTGRFGRVALVQPEIVLEVAFDGVQKSPRHKSGYALRFPRILRWRRDKSPAEADQIDTLRVMYERSLTQVAPGGDGGESPGHAPAEDAP